MTMDCPHGQLRRACETCDLAAENEQLRKCKPTQADTLAWVQHQWPDKCTPLDRAAKLCEEAGETIGAVIKISEGRKTPADLARETAQVTICAMALAEAAGFDLWAEVAAEYARVTERPTP